MTEKMNQKSKVNSLSRFVHTLVLLLFMTFVTFYIAMELGSRDQRQQQRQRPQFVDGGGTYYAVCMCDYSDDLYLTLYYNGAKVGETQRIASSMSTEECHNLLANCLQ